MGLLDRLIVGLLPVVPRALVWRVARRYVAGPHHDDALRAVRTLNAEGATATVSLLGEHVKRPAEALGAREEYMALSEALAEQGLRSGLSVKPSLLGVTLDEPRCLEHLDALARAASSREQLLRIDMEDHGLVDASLRLYRALAERHTGVGIVLQAYLRRTLADIDGLPPGANVRLCKGIYTEPRQVAWQAYETVRANFIAALEKLLERGSRVGIATHDEHLIWAGTMLANKLGVDPARVEFQMLLGVERRLRSILLDQGHRVRVYVPYGTSWYTYSLRRLRENPRVARYIIRAIFRRG